jgi:hypothetical protein
MLHGLEESIFNSNTLIYNDSVTVSFSQYTIKKACHCSSPLYLLAAFIWNRHCGLHIWRARTLPDVIEKAS